ncbi:MAG: OmpA family protein [Caulobacter sp.]|nr:OmpA family protein [Caulobacter sp.]
MGHILSGVAAAAVIAGGLALSGCATEQYVDEHVAAVNTRVDAVDSKVTALSGRVDQVAGAAQAAQTRADDAYALAKGKMSRTVVSETDFVNFDTNKWELSDEAKATLTAFAERLKGDNKKVFIEIVGHADPRGENDKNRVLGEKRALEVRRFLFSQGIPLVAMETVSWGEEQPVATGNTAEDLAANRRVVLRIVE